MWSNRPDAEGKNEAYGQIDAEEEQHLCQVYRVPEDNTANRQHANLEQPETGHPHQHAPCLSSAEPLHWLIVRQVRSRSGPVRPLFGPWHLHIARPRANSSIGGAVGTRQGGFIRQYLETCTGRTIEESSDQTGQ